MLPLLSRMRLLPADANDRILGWFIEQAKSNSDGRTLIELMAKMNVARDSLQSSQGTQPSPG